MKLYDELKTNFSLISERGIISGLYIGIILFGLIIGSNKIIINEKLILWIQIICFILGFIISSITYELLIPIFQKITSKKVLNEFNKITSTKLNTNLTSYNDIRKFREDFLTSNNYEHLKKRIIKDESLRQTITYLIVSSLISLIIILVCYFFMDINKLIIHIEIITVIYILFATCLGLINRSKTFGKTIGIAYVLKNKQRYNKAQEGMN